jgi:hypothetical protein
MLFKMIKKGAFEFDSPYWDEVRVGTRGVCTQGVERV